MITSRGKTSWKGTRAGSWRLVEARRDVGSRDVHICRYGELQRRLTELQVQREAARNKILRYKHLQTLLIPFKNPQVSVQPNLVTKDGELGRELDRMRILIARVTGKVEGLPRRARQQNSVEGPLDAPTEEEKLAGILGMR